MHPNLVSDSMDNATQPQHDFGTFLQNWMTRLERYSHQLLHLLHSSDQHDDDSNLQQLVRQVLTHYHEYSLANAQVSRRNVFLVLSPPWFSSYERALLWLGGFKPGLVIYVVKSCGVELSSHQAERIERLTAQTKEDERQITERLARLEQQVLAPPMLALAGIGRREANGVDTAVETLIAEDMEYLVGCADYLREKTVGKVVGILTAAQTVRFLAAMVQLQLRIRRRGQLRDANLF